MLFSKSLAVRPVRSYAEPAYPRAEDFDGFGAEARGGLLHRLGHPLVASAVLAAFSGTGCNTNSNRASPAPANGSKQVAPAPKPVSFLDEEYDPKKAYVNPFTWEASGLPVYRISFGTGQPARLSEKIARPVIEKIFSEAGLKLGSDLPFKREGVEFELDGYDAEKRVGFEFVTWEVLQRGRGVKNGGGESKTLSHEEIKATMTLGQEGKEHIAFISYQDKRFAYHYRFDREANERIQKIKDPAERSKAWQKLQTEGAAKVLKRLEDNLKQYLLWLRSQGAL
jgi:hypothetical protein